MYYTNLFAQLILRAVSILAFLLFLSFLSFLSSCTDSEVETIEKNFSEEPLETVIVEIKSVNDEIFFDGVIEAIHQSTVASETNARVIEAPFGVNDHVTKGQVIVRFRDTEQKALQSRAKAALNEAEAQLVNTKADYERAAKVFEKKLISRAKLENTTAAYEAAQARKKSAQAELNRANEQLEHTVIKAPFAGIVVKRHIEIGETATIGQPLMTGLSLEHLRARVIIPQNHIGPLRQHQSARVILPDGQSMEAKEIRIPPSADSMSHSFDVLALLPTKQLDVYPGTLVKVAFARGKMDRLVVPSKAVIQRGEITALYILDDNNRITFRYVRSSSQTSEGFTTLVSGAKAGERVIIDPVAAAIAYKKQSVSTRNNSQ